MQRSEVNWMNNKSKTIAILAGCAALFAVGCQSKQAEPAPVVGDLTSKIKKEFEEKRVQSPMAGVPRQMIPHNKEELIASANLNFNSRSNPFSLFSDEMAFETGIRYRIILGKLSPTYSLLVPPPVEEVPEELRPVERQPYRRVIGIYFGDSIKAMIRMEDGKSYLVTPGTRIGEWTVESIDAEKVVLVRDPSRRPSRVEVRLEAAPPGELTGGGG